MTKSGDQPFEEGSFPCRLCGSRRSVPRFPRLDLPVRRCLTCDAVFRAVEVTFEDLCRTYDEKYFLQTWPGSLGRFFGDFDPARHHKTRFFQRQIKHCTQLVGRPGRLLDVGCANGVFVWLAEKAGWQAEGLEISSFAAAHGRKQFEVVIHERPLEDLAPAAVYDVITFWDTLEHLPHPKAAIHAAFQRLKPGGFLAILTPNHQSLVNQLVHTLYSLFPRRALPLLEKLYHPDHLTYFDRDSLSLNLIEHGFLIHWIESYDEHPADTETSSLLRGGLYLLYPLASLLQLQHELLVWAHKPGGESGRLWE